MPYYRTPGTIRRAVDAVLAQTYTDLRLYVVNDADTLSPPWPMLDDITDERLVRIELPTNRGRYFADAAVIAASSEEWIAIHDSDDAARPDWLATLMHLCTCLDAVAAVAPQLVHRPDGSIVHEALAIPAIPPSRMKHIAHHAALYRGDVARGIGGHPGFRVGFDTLWVNIFAMLGRIGVADHALYDRYVRRDSLFNAAATRPGSVMRTQSVRNLHKLYRSALTSVDPASIIRQDVPLDLREAVTATADAIRDGTLTVARGEPRR
jgi:glycosyltransferase involved in cell wall biosynthesis